MQMVLYTRPNISHVITRDGSTRKKPAAHQPTLYAANVQFWCNIYSRPIMISKAISVARRPDSRPDESEQG